MSLRIRSGVAPVAHLQGASDDALLQGTRVNAATALAAGIITVRDLGDRAFLAVALRESFAAEPGSGPEIVAAGPPLTSPGGHCHFMGGEVTGEDGIRRAVRASVAGGVDLIMIMATGGALTPTTNPLVPQSPSPRSPPPCTRRTNWPVGDRARARHRGYAACGRRRRGRHRARHVLGRRRRTDRPALVDRIAEGRT
jgi:hypothetical protein